jgi:alpha-ribazole phosphatase
MPTRLILIRHGATQWNSEKRYLGFKDICLNDRGIRQAEKLKRRLNQEKVSRVYSSDRKRALEFAKIIFADSSIEKKPELREMNFGIFEGLNYKQIMKKYPRLYTEWLNDPFGITIPKGDGFYELRNRIRRFIRKIISVHKNKTVAIVTHSGPIRIIISEILKSKDIWKINVGLASLNIVEYRRGKAHWVR